MNQSLEKIIIIGLNLTLLVTIGVPLFLTTTQIITETEQSLSFQQFVNDVDEIILVADFNRTIQKRQLIIPGNVTLETEYNQLIFKIFIDSWHIITRTYRCTIRLSGSVKSGLQIFTVNATDTVIQVTIQSV
ncbi:MAG: hypothetical protein ACFE8O_04155 [Candidatus Hermodarchaeota archaeon]